MFHIIFSQTIEPTAYHIQRFTKSFQLDNSIHKTLLQEAVLILSILCSPSTQFSLKMEDLHYDTQCGNKKINNSMIYYRKYTLNFIKLCRRNKFLLKLHYFFSLFFLKEGRSDTCPMLPTAVKSNRSHAAIIAIWVWHTLIIPKGINICNKVVL